MHCKLPLFHSFVFTSSTPLVVNPINPRMNLEVLLQEVIKGMEASTLDEPEQPAPVSLFLRLPAELRLQIYELVLTQEFGLPCPYRARNQQTPQSQKISVVALLQVNRQIYFETRRLPYQLIAFALPNPFLGPFVRDRDLGYSVHDRNSSFITYFKDLLRSLQHWQKCEIRHLVLPITDNELEELWRKERSCAVLRITQIESIGNELDLAHLYAEQVLDVSELHTNLEKAGHWIAARFYTMTSLEKITIAGSEVRLKEEVLHHIRLY